MMVTLIIKVMNPWNVPGTVHLLIVTNIGGSCYYSHSVDEELRHGEEVAFIV